MYVFYYHNTLQHSKVIENKTIVAILLLYCCYIVAILVCYVAFSSGHPEHVLVI